MTLALPSRLVLALSLLLGCGASAVEPTRAPAAGSDAASSDSNDPSAADGASGAASLSEDETALDPVSAGQYRLNMSATCQARELTATGTLTLAPISPGDGAASDGALLWGQMDLDFSQFAGCLGKSQAAPGDPIHPGVLVEVLQWDGEPHHQVLLVSTSAARAEGARGAGGGVAMWVEHVNAGHIAGVWSRWELMGRGEGRWEAERLPRRR
ncbi:MAG TPA: hypothetical protein VNN80_08620 [Polyangiaceae bacterium]|nr:hypothetical protein [Polyangiaceae bacterium]